MIHGDPAKTAKAAKADFKGIEMQFDWRDINRGGSGVGGLIGAGISKISLVVFACSVL
jgi:hypothetical protein